MKKHVAGTAIEFEPEYVAGLKKIFEENKIPHVVAELSMVPQNYVKLEGKHAETMLKLMEALVDSDDVQKVYANFDIDEAEMERLTS